jgi:DNA-directed RNA polymerase subunit RPC12/RpoP
MLTIIGKMQGVAESTGYRCAMHSAENRISTSRFLRCSICRTQRSFRARAEDVIGKALLSGISTNNQSEVPPWLPLSLFPASMAVAKATG